MNRNIGEVFEYNGVKLKVVDDEHEGCINPCEGCYFSLHNFECLYDKQLRKIIGYCDRYNRKTHKGVKFIEIEEKRLLNTSVITC